MQYMPTGRGDFLGLGDYDGKKFLLAWKLGGFETFKEEPLRYLEIHTGYYSHGYGNSAHTGSVAQTRTAHVGLGLNLSELLFSQPGCGTLPSGLASARCTNTSCPTPTWRATAIPGARGRTPDVDLDDLFRESAAVRCRHASSVMDSQKFPQIQ